jgi:2-methylcitrate dehydratase PrpD
MTQNTLVGQLVDFATSVRYGQLPAEVIVECKRILLDSLGCAYAALSADKGKLAVQAGRRMGGAGEASVFGCGDRLSATSAAFVNGELISALDFEVFTSPPGHVAPYVLPALLAAAEVGQASGKQVIEAIAVAHEVSARIGASMSHYRDVTPGKQISFPAVTGYSSTIFGGTLACALVRGVDRKVIVHALGLAGHMAPAQTMTKWLHTLPASDSKYLMAGWMAQAELQALLLATTGYRGDVEVLEGEYGFSRYMGVQKWTPDALTDGLGTIWRFPQLTVYKPYPTCRISHTILDCIGALLDEHELQPNEIESIIAYCDPHAAVLPMFKNTTIATPGDAAMNVPYAVSMVVHGVKNGPEWHDDTTIQNDAFLAFMNKVKVLPHPHFEEALAIDPRSRIGSVEIRARGKSFNAERRYRQGSPATHETRMTDSQLIEKFKHCASRVRAESAERIASTIFRLEDVDNIAELARVW